MLLTGKATSRHNEDTLLGLSATLCLIDAANGLQREGVAQGTPCSAFLARLMSISSRGTIEAIGVSRVHPPSIRPIVEKRFKVLPINSPCLRAEGVINTHARGIVLAWRPKCKTALRPSLEVEEQTFLVQLAISLCHRTETCPNTYHEMSAQFVNFIYHLTSVCKLLGQKIHRIPEIVGTPILPILNDAIKRNTKFAVLLHNAQRLVRRLITFFRLPISVSPKREHGDIARQMTNLGNHTIGRAAIHKVVVDGFACFRCQGHTVIIVVELCWRIVIPIDTPPFYALDDALEVFGVGLLHTFVLSTTVHLAVLNGAQSIDGLILVELEDLANSLFDTSLNCPSRFLKQHFSAACQEGQTFGCRV